MADKKNLYSADALESVLELVWRKHGLRLKQEFVDCQLVSLDGQTGRLDVTAKVLPAGQHNPYKGSFQFVYQKADLDRIIPNDIVYDLEYPASFEALQSRLWFAYGMAVNAGEFEVVGQEGNGPFTTGSFLSSTPDAAGRVFLRALPSSLRWKAGGLLPLFLT